MNPHLSPVGRTRPGLSPTINTMLRSTIILLVLLRLAIGWQFLVEGWLKVESQQKGETVTSKPFTAEGYFRGAPGPLGDWMRSQLGDADEQAISLLVVQPVGQDVDPAGVSPAKLIPPGLDKVWNEYLERFAAYHELSDQKRKEAETKLQQSKQKVVEWLTSGEATVKRSMAGETHELPMSTPRRIAEYRAKLAELAGYREKRDLFWRDVDTAGQQRAKAEAASLRKELLDDLNGQTEEMKKALAEVLPDEHKAGEPPVPTAESRLLGYINWVTPWALTAIGGCLLVGLLTRTSCVLAALFLLMTYLAAPPLPWLPLPPGTEGNPVYVNKNLIEMLALLALATTASGRWFGLDALLGWIGGTLFGRERSTPEEPGTQQSQYMTQR